VVYASENGAGMRDWSSIMRLVQACEWTRYVRLKKARDNGPGYLMVG